MEIWFKQKTRPKIIGKTIKNFEKLEKKVKIGVKLPHVNKKPLARKRIFVQLPFSHTIFKLE